MIFLDSTYIIGLLLKRDNFTLKSLKLEPILANEKKLINNTVLNEVLNSLTRINARYDLNAILNSLYKYEIDFLTPKDYEESINLFKYYNQSINFSDCTILRSMYENNISTIVSFDSDFDKINGINRIFL